MGESKIADKFYGIVDFLKSNPDLIVPLLSILGTTFVIFYTVSAVLTRVSNYDKIRGLRGHSTKILDYELISYLIVFFVYSIIAYSFRETISIWYHILMMTASFAIVCFALKITKNSVRISIVAWIFIVFGAILGFNFMKNDWIFYFTTLAFLLFLIVGYYPLLQGDKRYEPKVEVGVMLNDKIRVMSGVIRLETGSEIFLEKTRVEIKCECCKEQEKKSYICRYNKSDIKYIKKELVINSNKTKG